MDDVDKFVRLWSEGRSMVVQAEGKGWACDGGCDKTATKAGYDLMHQASVALAALGRDEFGGQLHA